MSEKDYWTWLSRKQGKGEDDIDEPIDANPDGLSEDATPWLPRWTEVQREKLAAIQDSFNVLSDTQRRIIVMIYTENLTQTEIGKRLGISQQMVSKEVKKASSIIKKIFGRNSSKDAS